MIIIILFIILYDEYDLLTSRSTNTVHHALPSARKNRFYSCHFPSRKNLNISVRLTNQARAMCLTFRNEIKIFISKLLNLISGEGKIFPWSSREFNLLCGRDGSSHALYTDINRYSPNNLKNYSTISKKHNLRVVIDVGGRRVK